VLDLAPLLALAQRTALAAADHLRAAVDRTDLLISSKDSHTDLVTDADQASEALILDHLLSARPHDGMIAEEGTAITGTSGVDWMVDPLDGTTNFVYGHPGFSVSIAATVDGIPSIGVVADVLTGDLFAASLGGGATRNGSTVRCSEPSGLDRALVATGFSYEPDRRRRQAEILTEVLPQIRDIRRMGGAAIDLCSVACGRVDAYFERGLQPWDLAAGAVIASEAGARVGDLTGGPPSDAYCLAAHPEMFHDLVRLLVTAESGTF
jgi:myo-inositol-1(or 4)-monophosphatase